MYYFWLCWALVVCGPLIVVVEPGLYHCGGGAWALGFAASVVSAGGLSSCGLWALEHRLNSCGAWA